MSKTELNTITAGVVIIDKKNNVLVDKRNSKETLFPNSFSIPAGKHILGETLEETALREVKEEVNIDLKSVVFVNAYFWENNILFVYTSRVDSFEGIGKSHKEIKDSELAPNIKNAIKDAFELNKKYFQSISIRKIITDCTLLIEKNKIDIEDRTGWDHFIFQKRIGILGTALGLCILKYNEKIPKVNEAFQTLLSFQKSDGGWGIRGADNESSILECTCYCIKALFDPASTCYISQINEGKQWIITNRLNDFSWGVNKQSKIGRVTPTCLAIETLLMLGENDTIQNSLQWLLQNRNSDGGWGFNTNSQSCYSATSNVINLLVNIDKEKYRAYIDAAVSWINKQIERTTIHDESEQEYINSTKRFEFKHSTKVKVLKALVVSQNTFVTQNTHKLINEIINSQKDNGAWEHSLTPNLFPIWHLFDIINLLDLIEKKFSIDNITIINKYYDQLRIQNSLLQFISKNIPQISSKVTNTRRFS